MAGNKKFIVFLWLQLATVISYTQYKDRVPLQHQEEHIFVSIYTGILNESRNLSAGLGFGWDVIRINRIELSAGINYIGSHKKYRSYLNIIPNQNYTTTHRFQSNRIEHKFYIPFNLKFFYSRKLKFYSGIGYATGLFFRESENFFYDYSTRKYGISPSELIVENEPPVYMKQYDISCKRDLIQNTQNSSEKILHQINFLPLGLRLNKSRFELLARLVFIRGYSEGFFGIKYSYYIL